LRAQGQVLENPGEIGNQGFLGLLLAFEPREFVIATAHLSRYCSKGCGALLSGMLQARHFAVRVTAQRLQLFRRPLYLIDQILHARHALADIINFLGTGAGEISVQGRHSSRGGGIALVQQQLDSFLAADLVRCAHLRCQLSPLGVEGRLLAGLHGMQFPAALIGRKLGGAQNLQSAARSGDADLGLAQACAVRIALLEFAVQAVRQCGDAAAHLGEFGLCLSRFEGLVVGARRPLGRVGDGGGKRGTQQGKQA